MDSTTNSEVLFLSSRSQDVSVSATFPLYFDLITLEPTNKRRPATATENLVDFVVPLW